jgi:hypothetical protein
MTLKASTLPGQSQAQGYTPPQPAAADFDGTTQQSAADVRVAGFEVIVTEGEPAEGDTITIDGPADRAGVYRAHWGPGGVGPEGPEGKEGKPGPTGPEGPGIFAESFITAAHNYNIGGFSSVPGSKQTLSTPQGTLIEFNAITRLAWNTSSEGTVALQLRRDGEIVAEMVEGPLGFGEQPHATPVFLAFLQEAAGTHTWELFIASGGTESAGELHEGVFTFRAASGQLKALGSAQIQGKTPLAEGPPGTVVKLPIATVDWDVSGWWDAGAKRFVPQKKGLYLVTIAWFGEQSVEPAHWSDIAAAKNGVVVGSIFSRQQSASNAAGPEGGTSGIVQMNGTTDFLELFGGCVNGAAVGGGPLAGIGFLGIAYLGEL